MRTTRRHVLALTGAATAAIAMPHVARAQQKVIRMRLAHAANEVHPGHIATVKFKEALEKLVPGRVNVQIFPNRQLGDDKQSLEFVRSQARSNSLAQAACSVPARHRPPGACTPISFRSSSATTTTSPSSPRATSARRCSTISRRRDSSACRPPTSASATSCRSAKPVKDDRRFRRPQDPHRAGAAAQADLGSRRHGAGRPALWRGLQRAADQGDRRGRDQRVVGGRREPVGGRKILDADRALSLAQRHRRQQGVLRRIAAGYPGGDAPGRQGIDRADDGLHEEAGLCGARRPQEEGRPVRAARRSAGDEERKSNRSSASGARSRR